MPAQKLVDKHCLRILNMEPRNIPTNNSHHQLMTGEDVDSVASTDSSYPSDPSSAAKNGRFTCLTRRQIVTVAVLCFVNLINYMDRFTIAAVLEQVKKYYGANNSSAGLLQTAFVFSYMIFAPAFGYLGDRYSRRWIMAGGVFMWSLTTLVGSYMENFHAFLFFRALVGIGEASYSTIAPTIISDLFVKNVRSRMLAIFYFAIPVGSGLGYIIGSETYKIAGQWQYALRVTPVMGVIAVLLIIFLMQDPARGESEGRTHDTTTSWFEDIRALFKNYSFMLSTLGFTCVTFVTGALAWWGPNFLVLGLKLQNENYEGSDDNVAFVFGIITMVSGVVGVPLGSYLGQILRSRFPRADPLVCGCGLLISVPFLISSMFLARYNIVLCYVVMFFGELALNLNWAIVADILLYVVVPTRRSTAEAFNILFSHALGDAGSPYLIGVISVALQAALSPTGAILPPSDANQPKSREEIEVEFLSLQYALFITCFVEVIGGLLFLLTAVYIVHDKIKASGDDCEQPRHIYADQTYLTHEQSQNLVT
ncbi:hypothetical protein R5R35_011072 [Gryllus longicercus]|uniref:Major facilitator superfamily (MFS) profile domain-containing protein n=1 Tax=Gryllus longicercus TaxID=2509291 RepID=A0AAN9ZCU5_9ORTH